ncbi:unnamed protein product [Owenia fusiformis]|uniref:Synaptosomal-associated protein n=1 Tax=Owenia fusiformis TaxID=6347 RepID=A0A8J1U292_OWEFU|nr:unnamed protein product [Owenia fusiformis]
MDRGGDDDMRSELRDYQMQANAVTDQSLDSTRRMLQMSEESQDVGVKTLVMLDEQGEQLNRIEDGVEKINADVKVAEANLRQMEKCCGLCLCPPWKRIPSKDSEFNSWQPNKDGEPNTKGPQARMEDKRGQYDSGPGGGYITRVTNDAREDEMEENLQQVGGIVGNLKMMAMDMGNTIDSQNKQLDRTTHKANVADDRVKGANQRAMKLIK